MNDQTDDNAKDARQAATTQRLEHAGVVGTPDGGEFAGIATNVVVRGLLMEHAAEAQVEDIHEPGSMNFVKKLILEIEKNEKKSIRRSAYAVRALPPIRKFASQYADTHQDGGGCEPLPCSGFLAASASR